LVLAGRLDMEVLLEATRPSFALTYQQLPVLMVEELGEEDLASQGLLRMQVAGIPPQVVALLGIVALVVMAAAVALSVKEALVMVEAVGVVGMEHL
jgi:hypothetical protein